MNIYILETSQSSRTDMAALLKCHWRLTVARPHSWYKKALRVPDFPIALGERLFARRRQLGLSLFRTAQILGIKSETYKSWEADLAKPELGRLPLITAFLGFTPFDASLPFRDKLVVRRSFNGVSQKDFASIVAIDQSTLAKWERGETRPSSILRQRVRSADRELGRIGLYKFRFGADHDNTMEGSSREADRPDAPKIPRIRIGTLTISFPPSLFVFYDGSWTIGKKLETWRTSLGLSQREFGTLTGFAYQTISRWENGRRLPAKAHIDRIVRAVTTALAHYRTND